MLILRRRPLLLLWTLLRRAGRRAGLRHRRYLRVTQLMHASHDFLHLCRPNKRCELIDEKLVVSEAPSPEPLHDCSKLSLAFGRERSNLLQLPLHNVSILLLRRLQGTGPRLLCWGGLRWAGSPLRRRTSLLARPGHRRGLRARLPLQPRCWGVLLRLRSTLLRLRDILLLPRLLHLLPSLLHLLHLLLDYLSIRICPQQLLLLHQLRRLSLLHLLLPQSLLLLLPLLRVGCTRLGRAVRRRRAGHPPRMHLPRGWVAPKSTGSVFVGYLVHAG